MSTNTYGETDYSEGNGGSGGGKVEFLRLSQGTHQIRLLTKPWKYSCHKGVKAVGEKGFGRKVPCSATYTGEGKNTVYNEGTCVVCDAGLKPKQQYMYWVLDRDTGTAKLIDITWSVFSVIKGFASSKIWKDPQTHDIVVQKNAQSHGSSDYYITQPVPHTPLTPAEQNIRDTVDIEWLKSHTAPWSKEAVQKILDKVLDGGELYIPPVEEKESAKDAEKSKAQAKPNGKKATTVPATELVVDASEDLDSAFPNYDATN